MRSFLSSLNYLWGKFAFAQFDFSWGGSVRFIFEFFFSYWDSQHSRDECLNVCFISFFSLCVEFLYCFWHIPWHAGWHFVQLSFFPQSSPSSSTFLLSHIFREFQHSKIASPLYTRFFRPRLVNLSFSRFYRKSIKFVFLNHEIGTLGITF